MGGRALSRVLETLGSEREQGHVTEAPRARFRVVSDDVAEPAISKDLGSRLHPRELGVSLALLEESLGLSGSRVQPSKATFTRLMRNEAENLRIEIDQRLAGMNLAVIADDRKTDVVGQTVEDRRREAVRVSNFGVVMLSEAVKVSGGVDAVVIRIHESGALVECPTHIHGDRAGTAPASVVRTSLMGFGEASGCVLGSRHDRHVAAAERNDRLNVGRSMLKA